MTPLPRRFAAALVAPALAAMALLAASPAHATALTDPGDASRPAFYQAPAQLPAANGGLVKAEPEPFYLDPVNLAGTAVTSQRIMYKSTDRTGAPTAVTGTVIVPTAPWAGWGSRPLISFAVGTQGLADRCAPSRLLSFAAEYEEVFAGALLARGYAVAITDYEGLGTAGVHTYMDRVSQAHAVLDVARAALQLPGTGLDTATPVGIAGYSQGGGASAAAGELAPQYAPELRVRGVASGAVPADLTAVGANLDGGPYAEFMLYALDGMSASYRLDPATFLNAAGQQVAQSVTNDCVSDLALHAGTQMSSLTPDGAPFSALAARGPFPAMLGDQLIGRLRPSAPVLITHSIADDVIPYSVGVGLAKRWCSGGATVDFVPTLAPTHVGGAAPHFGAAVTFFEARFTGVAPVNNCWTL